MHRIDGGEEVGFQDEAGGLAIFDLLVRMPAVENAGVRDEGAYRLLAIELVEKSRQMPGIPHIQAADPAGSPLRPAVCRHLFQTGLVATDQRQHATAFGELMCKRRTDAA